MTFGPADLRRCREHFQKLASSGNHIVVVLPRTCGAGDSQCRSGRCADHLRRPVPEPAPATGLFPLHSRQHGVPRERCAAGTRQRYSG
jgi:hypothetical protein